jgi:hypothetical protein
VTSAPQPEQSGPSVTEPEDVSNNKLKWGQRGCNKMSSDVVYVTKLDSNGLPSEPLKQGKHSNVLSDFKLETMSQSPSQIGGKCMRP